MQPKFSRIPAPPVQPIEIAGVRYEQVRNGLTAGLDQMGGYLAAVDPATGHQLWTLKVYDNRRDPALEGDVHFFRSMTLQADGKLLIENERRVRFVVDTAAARRRGALRRRDGTAHPSGFLRACAALRDVSRATTVAAVIREVANDSQGNRAAACVRPAGGSGGLRLSSGGRREVRRPALQDRHRARRAVQVAQRRLSRATEGSFGSPGDWDANIAISSVEYKKVEGGYELTAVQDGSATRALLSTRVLAGPGARQVEHEAGLAHRREAARCTFALVW